jgi:hypothetical protein
MIGFLHTGCEQCKNEWEDCCGKDLSNEEIEKINEEVERICASDGNRHT